MSSEPRGRIAAAVADKSRSSRDDPGVASSLEHFLSQLQAGLRPSREAFLAEHPKIASELAECLDVLEFVHSAGGAESSLEETSLQSPALPRTTTLGDFRLIREVGRGGVGVVYEAEQVSLGRRVALKVLPFTSALDPKQLQRFRIESHAAAQLHHPHIVPVYAVGSDSGLNYYAMQFIEGRTLAAVIRELRGVSINEKKAEISTTPSSGTEASGDLLSTSRGKAYYRAVAVIGLQAAQALDHAHSLGVIHRDIKPGNLLLDKTGVLWVADFGLARLRDDPGPTRTGDVLGTLRYMSPEQIEGRQGSVDERSDIYALGATLYEALTLRPAFDGRDRQALLKQVLFDEPFPPRKIDRSIPRALETVVLKALSKEPQGRYASVKELAEDLRRFLDEKPILAKPPTPIERVARWARRHRTSVTAASAVLFVSLLVGAGLLWNEQSRTAKALKEKEAALLREEKAMDVIVMAAHAVTMRAMEAVTKESDPSDDKPRDRAFLEQALSFYASVISVTKNDPNPQRQEAAAKALFGMGLIRLLTDRPGAEESLRRSLDVYDALVKESPGNTLLAEHRLASLKYLAIGILQTRGLKHAEPCFVRLIALERELVASNPANPTFIMYLANDLKDWGETLEEAGRAEEAKKVLQEAKQIMPDQSSQPPADKSGAN